VEETRSIKLTASERDFLLALLSAWPPPGEEKKGAVPYPEGISEMDPARHSEAWWSLQDKLRSM
jgi:hypothetical protein